jgi:hypothetical protein
MRKVKILHIIGNIAPGGCEKQLLELCRRIDKEKFKISILWYTSVPDAMDNEFRECGVATIFFANFLCRYGDFPLSEKGHKRGFA